MSKAIYWYEFVGGSHDGARFHFDNEWRPGQAISVEVLRTTAQAQSDLRELYEMRADGKFHVDGGAFRPTARPDLSK